MIRSATLALVREGYCLASETVGDGVKKSAAAVVGMVVASTLTGLLLRGEAS